MLIDCYKSTVWHAPHKVDGSGWRVTASATICERLLTELMGAASVSFPFISLFAPLLKISMSQLYRHLLAGVMSLSALGAWAQPVAPATEPYALRLAVGDVVPPANAAAWLREPATPPADAWQGRVYRLLQFTHLPTEAQRAQLSRAGVVLFDYLPLNAYTASLPATLPHALLANVGLRSVTPMPSHWKLAGALAQGTVPAHARRAGSQLEVVLSYHPALTAAQATEALRSAGFQPAGQNDFAHQLTAVIPEAAVDRLAALPWVSTVEAGPGPDATNNFRGRTDHRANALATDYGAGRHYDGRGVTVGHFDAGAIGAHIDFQGRLNMSSSTPTLDDHAAHTAGTIMGAGNLEPRNRGQAVGAFNFYQYFNGTINTQTPADYANRQVRVTSNSYITPTAVGYNTSARTMDQQMRQLPFLLHVFAAGNEGTANFNYGAGPGWGNIGPGYTQSKNQLAVGAVDYRDVLAGFSSRGPAIDGRIKPEVCGVGVAVTSAINGNAYDTYQGTSMATPGVSGVTAQLIGAYRSLNNTAEAPGALIKAVLMNTAEDLGNPGPDFRYGYGRINGLRAVRVLEGGTYFRDTLSQGQTRTFTIPGQAGKRQLRVMLYWNDFEAATNARPNLVNNLDLLGYVGAAGSSTPIQPWILDHRATVAQLNATAVQGRDSINNAEQITIDNPTGSSYSFTVSGRAVPQGPQGFWLTYSYIDEGVELTYPLGGEGFVPGETEVLRWDAADSSQPFLVQYGTDNGTSVTYRTIATNMPGTARSVDWLVPNTTVGRVRIRVTRGTVMSESPATFSIAALPTNLRSEYRCATESKLTWTASVGATSYTVYRLGAFYMDSVTTVTTPFAVLPGVGSGSVQWLAVRARGANGLLSRRTRAMYQPAGARDCPGPPQVAFFPNRSIVCPGSTVQLADSTQSYPTSWLWSVSPSAGVTFVNGTLATSQHPRVQFTNLGIYTVTLTATNSYGSTANTSQVTVSYGLPLAFSEAFMNTQSMFPPAGWQVVNPSSNYTWQLSPSAIRAPDNTNRRLPMAPNFSDPLRGAEDYLVTPPLNIGGSTSPELTFAVAYRPASLGSQDGLRVEASTDCGLTFQPTSYIKSGINLATVATPITTSYFPTSATHWRRETVDLSPFLNAALPASQPQTVLVRFVNFNGYSNNLYLSDVAVAGRVVSTTARSNSGADLFTAHPVPFGNRLQVALRPAVTGPATLQLLDALGREVRHVALAPQPGIRQVELDTEALPVGVYVLRLSSSGGTQQVKVVK